MRFLLFLLHSAFLRGRPISRDMQEVIDEVERLVSQGCKEVVLTGVHLRLYGSRCDFDLGDLVKSLAKIKGLKRLRFGSIEPLALDDKLLRLLAESEIFCRHLHIPLQSGDDGILGLMRRVIKPRTSRTSLKMCDVILEMMYT